MSMEQNKSIIRRHSAACARRDFAALDEYMAEDIVTHDFPPMLPQGREGYRMFLEGFFAAFPDASIEPADLFAEGDRVCVRYHCRGRNTGPFMGMPPTNREVTFDIIDIFRLANGKIVERWGQTNLATALATAPATAPAEQATAAAR